MFNKLCDHRGAVSVFLVIVLLPTILCASLFVDASRVESAKGLVSSAGDLTLNTVLSQYDVDLNDFYGLMASAQDMDDVLGAAEDYFTACIKSQGINTTDTAKYVNSISGFFFGDDSISDLLGLDLADNAKVNVSPINNGSLTNTALVKTQIVEFMKYRSPINSVVDLLKKFQDSSKELENTTKTTDLVEKKQDYYEAQGDVAKKAYDIYKLIEEYSKLKLNKSDLEEIKKLLTGIDGKYKEIHIKMVKDLYNTSGISKVNDTFKYCVTIPDEYTSKKKNQNADVNKMGREIVSLISAYDQFIAAKNNFDNNIKAWSNNYYDIQYVVYAFKNKSYFTNVYNKEINLKNSFIKVKDMVEHAKDGELDKEYTSTRKSTNLGVTTTTKKTISEWYTFLESKVKSAAKTVTDSGTKYNTAVYKIRSTSNIYDRISASSSDTKLSELYNSLNNYYSRYKKADEILTKIVNGLSVSTTVAGVKVSKCLKDLIIEADNKFNTWEKKAKEYEGSISLATSDLKEIKEVKKDNPIIGKISTKDVDAYTKHINNVKSAVGTVKKSIQGVKYNGTSVIDKEINSISRMKKYADVLESEIPLNKYDLDTYANNSFKFSTDNSISSLNITESNDPVIASKKYRVYEWMIEQKFPLPKDEDKENEYNSKKDKADEQAKDAKKNPLSDVSSKNDIKGQKNLPSGASSDLDAGKITTKISEVSDFVSGLFSDFSSTVSSAGANLRDDFFALDYITSMFTYHTFEYEAKYNMLSETQKKAITYSNANSYYGKLSDNWKSTDVTKTFNKTLTNKMRNSESSNWSYGNEVEYIMYGKGIKESKDSLNGSIYMIRFALNVAPIFSAFYNDNSPGGLNSFAKAVNAATHGIIPAGLVKVIICLGLVALESATDMQTLKAGIPVILVKTKEDDLFVKNWWFEVTDDKNPRKTDKTKAVTFFYSDYMKLFLFTKLIGSEEKNIYGRVADVIQVNMSKCVLKDDEYALSKSQVYYSINANLTVKPLMLDTSYIDSIMPGAAGRMDKWNKIEYKSTRGY